MISMASGSVLVFDAQELVGVITLRDIVRAACAYLDTEPDQARTMIEAWRAAGGDSEGLAPWLPLYVASERVSIWAHFVGREPRPAWSLGATFRSWAESYLERLNALL